MRKMKSLARRLTVERLQYRRVLVVWAAAEASLSR